MSSRRPAAAAGVDAVDDDFPTASCGFRIISAAQAMTDAHTRAITLIRLHVSAAAAAVTIVVFTFTIFM